MRTCPTHPGHPWPPRARPPADIPAVRSGADIRITAKVDIFGHFWTFLYHGLVEMSTLAVIVDVCPGPHSSVTSHTLKSFDVLWF